MRRANSPPKFRWPIIACRKHRFHPLKSGFFKSTGQQVNGSTSCFGDFESSKFRVSVDKNRSPSAKKQNPVGTWYFTSAHNFNTILNINHLARTRSIASLPWKIVLGDWLCYPDFGWLFWVLSLMGVDSVKLIPDRGWLGGFASLGKGRLEAVVRKATLPKRQR